MMSLAVCGKWAHFSIFGSFLIIYCKWLSRIFLPTFTVQFSYLRKMFTGFVWAILKKKMLLLFHCSSLGTPVLPQSPLSFLQYSCPFSWFSNLPVEPLVNFFLSPFWPEEVFALTGVSLAPTAKRNAWVTTYPSGAHSSVIEVSGFPQSEKKRTTPWGPQFLFARANKSPPKPAVGKGHRRGTDVDRSTSRSWEPWRVARPVDLRELRTRAYLQL